MKLNEHQLHDNHASSTSSSMRTSSSSPSSMGRTGAIRRHQKKRMESTKTSRRRRRRSSPIVVRAAEAPVTEEFFSEGVNSLPFIFGTRELLCSEDVQKDVSYRMHRYSLRFRFQCCEDRYRQYLYRDSTFPGEKPYLVIVIAGSIGAVSSALVNGKSVLQSMGDIVFISFWAVILLLTAMLLWFRTRIDTRKFEVALLVLYFCVSTCFVTFMLTIAHRTEDGLATIFIQPIVSFLALRARFHLLAPTQLLSSCCSVVIYMTREDARAKHAVWLLSIWLPIVLSYIFEKLLRLEFTSIDRAAQQLRNLETNTQLMQARLATVFPPTAARHLMATGRHPLARAGGDGGNTSDKDNAVFHRAGPTHFLLYRQTALVVTDAAGFTAWVTRTDPAAVIRMLSQLFEELDASAVAHGVEKIATVGDSFVGAVFPAAGDDPNGDRTFMPDDIPGTDSSCDADDQRKMPTDMTERTAASQLQSQRVDRRADRAVTNALHFALDAVRLPHYLNMPLRNRVGVHCGDVLCGFVGISPPVFDVFGDAVREVKALESSGEPSCVHMSHHALERACRCGGSPCDATPTALGVLLSSWTHGSSSSLLDKSALSAVDSSASSSLFSGDASADKACVMRECVIGLADDGEDGVAPAQIEAQSIVDPLAQHTVWRSFCDPVLETQYLQQLKRRAPMQRLMMLAVVGGVLFACALHVLFGCTEESWDRGALAFELLASLSFSAGIIVNQSEDVQCIWRQLFIRSLRPSSLHSFRQHAWQIQRRTLCKIFTSICSRCAQWLSSPSLCH
eukprot:PhM_4_TR10444/c1_g2_i2/m.72524